MEVRQGIVATQPVCCPHQLSISLCHHVLTFSHLTSIHRPLLPKDGDGGGALSDKDKVITLEFALDKLNIDLGEPLVPLPVCCVPLHVCCVLVHGLIPRPSCVSPRRTHRRVSMVNAIGPCAMAGLGALFHRTSHHTTPSSRCLATQHGSSSEFITPTLLTPIRLFATPLRVPTDDSSSLHPLPCPAPPPLHPTTLFLLPPARPPHPSHFLLHSEAH